jgi:hypothetical protein
MFPDALAVTWSDADPLSACEVVRAIVQFCRTRHPAVFVSRLA